MSWAEILKDAVAAKLDIIDGDEKAMLFYRELSDEKFDRIRSIIRRLVEWSVWTSPRDSEIDRVLADNKSEVKKYMKSKGLTAGYLLGASEQNVHNKLLRADSKPRDCLRIIMLGHTLNTQSETMSGSRSSAIHWAQR